MRPNTRLAIVLYPFVTACLALAVGATGPAGGVLRALLSAGSPLCEQPEEQSDETKGHKDHSGPCSQRTCLPGHRFVFAAHGRSDSRPAPRLAAPDRPAGSDPARESRNGVGGPLRC